MFHRWLKFIRHLRLLLILVIIPAISFSQSLAEIKTREQAANFIRENFNYYGHRYDLFVIDTADLDFDSFKKGDFDHDGVSDLLIFGTAQVTAESTTYKEDEIVILMGDKKKPRRVTFPYHFFRSPGIHDVPYPKVIHFDQKDYILIRYRLVDRKQVASTFYDTLYIKYDHVVPLADAPSNKEITRIEFKTSHCYGRCPVFEMTMDSNLDVVYNGVDHVDKKGLYDLKMGMEDWDYMTTLLRNLKVETLRDHYDVDWTDDQTGFLTITFKDGTKKSIRDYGLKGTFGLSVLYDFLFELRKF